EPRTDLRDRLTVLRVTQPARDIETISDVKRQIAKYRPVLIPRRDQDGIEVVRRRMTGRIQWTHPLRIARRLVRVDTSNEPVDTMPAAGCQTDLLREPMQAEIEHDAQRAVVAISEGRTGKQRHENARLVIGEHRVRRLVAGYRSQLRGGKLIIDGATQQHELLI